MKNFKHTAKVARIVTINSSIPMEWMLLHTSPRFPLSPATRRFHRCPLLEELSWSGNNSPSQSVWTCVCVHTYPQPMRWEQKADPLPQGVPNSEVQCPSQSSPWNKLRLNSSWAHTLAAPSHFPHSLLPRTRPLVSWVCPNPHLSLCFSEANMS